MHYRRHHRHHHFSDGYDDDNPMDEEDTDDYSNDDNEWQGYFRCDDLYPPLCDDQLRVTTGTVETTPGIVITYWKYTPKHVGSNKHPLVVINGGPGLPHNFVKPTRSLACDGRQVVLYDQAGTGASQIDPQSATANFPELLTIDYYALVELPALLRHLGWEQYHILAESWGTQIAFQFAVHTHKSMGLRSLMLNAPIADNPRFIRYQWDPVDGTVGQMPTYLQQRLQYYNRTQDFDNPEFMQLEESVISNFNARIGVEVDCWIETEEAGISGIDYSNLTGPSDLFYAPATANLHGWTVLPELYRLSHIPVQLNHGQFDLVRPHLIADTAAALNKVECHFLARAAHSILLDEPLQVMEYLQDFLLRVEGGAFVPNGTCPVWKHGQIIIKQNHGNYLLEIILSLLLAIGMAFWVGLGIGTRRNKGFMGGYEQVHHDHAVTVKHTNTIEME